MVTVGDILQFFNQMDNDLKTAAEISIEEQDRLCRERGWPTITEQKKYWDSLPHEGQEIALFTEIKNTLEKLTQAVEGLLAITKYQQEQINTIKQYLNNNETHQPPFPA